MVEKIVTGKYYRILMDEKEKLYHRISFWTHGEDVELNDGTSLQDRMDLIYNHLGTNTIVNRWLRFDPDNKKGLIIKAGTMVKLNNGEYFTWMEDTKIDLTSSITKNGADYYVYVSNGGTVSASTDDNLSLTKIGRFHTLCVSTGTIEMIAPAAPSSGLNVGGNYLVKSYRQSEDPDFYAFYNKKITAVTVQAQYDVITMEHPLSGFSAGDILPESVFCLGFNTECLVEDAMVYDKDTNRAVDIYLQSGKGFETRSKYNGSHTVSRQSYNHSEDYRMIGKRLLRDCEFTSAALGSNERTAIVGSADKTTVGGHSDTAGRRMISAIGCEEMCGYIWQWLDEVSPSGGSSWGTTDGHASFGQEYGIPYVLLAGGAWGDSSYCGSRCRHSNASRSTVLAFLGGRGSSHVIAR